MQGIKSRNNYLRYILKRFTMTRVLVFVTLGVLPALWSSAFSSLLDPRAPVAATKNVDETTTVDVSKYCHSCVKIDDFCYNNTYLFELSAPFGLNPVVKKMGIMKFNNVLYYTFEPKFNDPEYSKAAYVSLYSPTYSAVISGRQIFNFGTFDINQIEKKVYLGGSDGIWVVDSTSLVPRFYAVKGKHVTNIVSKDYVYFTRLDHTGIIKNLNGYYTFILGDQTINKFVLDVNNNVVYLNASGLFISFNSGSQRPVRLSTERFIKGLTVDAWGTVYAWHVSGIYKVVLGKVLSRSTLKRVSGITPDAMTFDASNNIIYSMRKSLYKLSKVANRNC